MSARRPSQQHSYKLSGSHQPIAMTYRERFVRTRSDNFQLWKFCGRYLSIFRCTKRIWRTRSGNARNVTYLRRWPTSSPRCTSTSLWKAMRTLISKMESHKKVADFITVCPKSVWETRCNGHSGKWGKCTKVSFIRRSESFLETSCIVFTKT